MGRAPSHGPYWYVCGSRGGKWRRVYLGVNLDTARFVAPDGSIDWKAVSLRNNGKIPSASPMPERPAVILDVKEVDRDQEHRKHIRASIKRVETAERRIERRNALAPDDPDYLPPYVRNIGRPAPSVSEF